MFWHIFLFMPLFPAEEIAIKQPFEVIYPATGEIIAHEFQTEPSPFLIIHSHTVHQDGLRLSLTHVSLSNLTIPPLRLTTLENNQTNSILFHAWELRVKPTNITITNLNPIADLFPFHDHRWIWWLLLVLCLLVAAIFFWRRRQQSRQVSPQQDTHQESIADALHTLKLHLETLEEKTYYSEIALILRRILEEVYGFPAKEMGSREIAPLVPVEKSLKDTILDILKRCDRVKYARHRAGLEKRHEIFSLLEDVYTTLLNPEKEEETTNAH